MKRFILAFLGAPLVPAFIQTLISTYDAHPLAILIIVCGLLYVWQLSIGLPAYLLLRRRGRHRLAVYAFAGFGAMALPILLAFSYQCWTKSCRPEEVISLTIAVGLLGAATFAMFWLMSRPDKFVVSRACSAR